MKSYFVICNCKSLYQDAVYGDNKRVATPKLMKNPKDERRDVVCTVCGKIHHVAS